MDEETRVLLSGAYQELDLHASALTELQVVMMALISTIRELGPEAAALYAKHYEAQNLGPLKPADAVRHEGVVRLIQRLEDEQNS
jgi:hypothetical protein